MGATRKERTCHDDVETTTVTEIWDVDGVPTLARDDPALPQGWDAQAEIPACLVVARDFEYRGGKHGNQNTVATIHYSNAPPLEVDGDAVLIYDMMASTERKYWDVAQEAAGVDQPDGLGVDGNGIEIFVPHMEIIYEHMESAFQEAVVGELTGTVNNGVWKGRAAGTVLFRGARGRRVEVNKWRVTYHFIYHPEGMATKSWLAHYDIPNTDGDNVPDLRRKWSRDVQTGTVYLPGNFGLLPF